MSADAHFQLSDGRGRLEPALRVGIGRRDEDVEDSHSGRSRVRLLQDVLSL